MVAFRLFVAFCFIAAGIWFLYKIRKAKDKDKDIKNGLSVQETISDLEIKIRLLEIKARQGIKGAQEELEKNKLDLEKIVNLQEKLKN